MDESIAYEQVRMAIDPQPGHREAVQGASEKSGGEIVVPSTVPWCEGSRTSMEGSWVGY
jgi:hypothetical protein